MTALFGRLALCSARVSRPLTGSSSRSICRPSVATTKVTSSRGYASPSKVTNMATPIEVTPETKAGRGSMQKVMANGE